MTKQLDVDSLDRANIRKTRSRDALHAAFLGLLEEKTLDQISIREIAAVAKLSHATFYRHYPGKEELLDDVAADELRHVVKLALEVMHKSDTQAACLAQCQYIEEHRTLWKTLLTGGAAQAVKDELLSISRSLAAEVDVLPNALLPQKLSTALIVTAIIEIFSWWLEDEEPAPADKVAHYMSRVITSKAFV